MPTASQFPGRFTCPPPAITTTAIPPVTAVGDGQQIWHIDFGKAWFGTLSFIARTDQPVTLHIHLGEKLTDASRDAARPEDRWIDRQPPGSIRYRCIALTLKPGCHAYRLDIPPDARNTGKAAILMPPQIGEVLPFRYAEIEPAQPVADANWSLEPDSLRLLAAHGEFEPKASDFQCSDPVLNAIWDLCKHTIQATTFCGLYIDGDRERIPYEGDAYLNQLSHYACDWNPTVARYTLEYLIQYPTWFSDWYLHTIFMAWADYFHTGRTETLACFHDDLAAKTLIDLADHRGLISLESPCYTPQLEQRLHLHHHRSLQQGKPQDLVDWPPGSFTDGGIGERDNHDMQPINTVVNALHYHAARLMGRMAAVLNRQDDARRFTQHARRTAAAINNHLFDPVRGIYIDGMDLAGKQAEHASLHANMFPLAFGLVPPQHQARVIAFIRSRGMACSVYGAQYLLESLYAAGQADHALNLLTSRGDRSWWAMLQAGSTMTMEAWGLRYKKNLDWNHAWGAAPVNLIPRHLMGIQPAAPGFTRVTAQPQPASLKQARMITPTPFGPITAEYDAVGPQPTFAINAPAAIEVTCLPPPTGQPIRYILNGQSLPCP